MHMTRGPRGPVTIVGVVLAAIVGGGTLVDAGSPSPVMPAGSPLPSAGASVSPGSVVWQDIDGPSGVSTPSVDIGAADVIAWTGRFAAVEDGVRVSPDGRAWDPHPLPSAIDGPVSLLPWHGGLLAIEQRPRERGWRFRLWSSADGQEWRRAGTFDQRPVGRLEGCAFTYPHVMSTDTRILAMASCTPYANGRLAPSVAQLSAVVGPDVRAPIWAWTSDDGTHWDRRLVTDRLDPRGAVQAPVLVRAIGDGFAAILCCYPPRVWWSDDGASWREAVALPGSVSYDTIEALNAFVRDGRPATWLLVADKDHEIGEGGVTGALGGLWTGDASGWTEVISQPDWQDGRIATDADVAVVVTVKILDEDPELVRLDTLTSIDSGRSWTVSEGEALVPDACCLGGLATDGGRAVLAGPWGPDRVSLRAAEVLSATP
jgi:hypothetical protein